jgi:peptidoglycan/LPS O-acetylase OafA/YrhL
MNQGSVHRIPALDFLRSLAVILVILRHALYMFNVYDPNPEFSSWILEFFPFFLNGWIGVDLFFVLSGFLIARQFLYEDKKNIKTYFYKRVLRIVPLYYAVLLLCLIGFFPGYNVNFEGKNISLEILYHLLFLQDYFPSNINIVFWSLGVEEKFYILAPLILGALMMLYNKNRNFFWASIFLLIIGGVVLRTATYIYGGEPTDYREFLEVARFPFHCCFDPLIFGVAIAFFEKFKNGRNLNLQIHAKWAFILFGSALFLFLFQKPVLGEITFYDASLQPLFISIIMAGLVWSGVMGGIPNQMDIAPIRFTAKISYGLYLVHLPLWPISYYITRMVSDGEIISYSFIMCLIAVLFTLSFILAFLLYNFIEKPFLNLKNKL